MKKTVLSLLRAIADAPSQVEVDSAVDSLKNHSIWKNNEKLQTWLNGRWLNDKHIKVIILSPKL